MSDKMQSNCIRSAYSFLFKHFSSLQCRILAVMCKPPSLLSISQEGMINFLTEVIGIKIACNFIYLFLLMSKVVHNITWMSHV